MSPGGLMVAPRPGALGIVSIPFILKHDGFFPVVMWQAMGLGPIS